MDNNWVRVENVTKYDIGLILLNGLDRTIRPGMTIPMKRDDVEYAMQIAPSLFAQPSQLVVHDEELNTVMGIDTKADDVADTDFIKKKLKGRADHLKAWLDGVEDGYLLEKVIELAREMDLPASKMKVLRERIPGRVLDE